MTRETNGQAVTEAVADRRDLVNEAVERELPIERPERLYEASRYLLDAGGKRLRPAVLLLVAESLADVEPLSTPYQAFPDLHGSRIDVMTAAVSIEVIQSFTLIHDDIMDDDDLRRGVPSVHRAYDLETAILAGDTLYSKAFELILDCDAPADRTLRALDRLATTCTKICEGQAFDVEFEGRSDVDEEEYLEMVELKTAVLYGAAASVPAILLGADDRTVEGLYRFGLDVGRAFQIQDDLLDLTTPSDRLGKRRGSDLIEGKRTIVTVHAMERGVDPGSLVGDDRASVTEAEVDAAVERLEDLGSIDYARKQAGTFVDRAKRELQVLPANETRDLLGALADFVIERGY